MEGLTLTKTLTLALTLTLVDGLSRMQKPPYYFILISIHLKRGRLENAGNNLIILFWYHPNKIPEGLREYWNEEHSNKDFGNWCANWIFERAAEISERDIHQRSSLVRELKLWKSRRKFRKDIHWSVVTDTGQRHFSCANVNTWSDYTKRSLSVKSDHIVHRTLLCWSTMNVQNE